MRKTLFLFLTILLAFGHIHEAKAQSVVLHPGDATDDGRVDHIDLLPIGLAYGKTGPSRMDSGFSFTPQTAMVWMDSIAYPGHDAVFMDCNGDGRIDSADLEIILKHHNKTHTAPSMVTAFSTISTSAPALFALPMVDTVEIDTVSQLIPIPIHLGTIPLPMSDVYGVAFTIELDTKYIDYASSSIDFSRTWLSSTPGDVLSFSKTLSNGDIQVSMVRNDHLSALPSSGEIVNAGIVVEGIIAETPIVSDVNIRIKDVVIIDNSGSLIQVNAVDNKFVVRKQIKSSIEPFPSPSSDILFPNPNSGLFTLRLQDFEQMEALKIYSLDAKEVAFEILQGTNKELLIQMPEKQLGQFLLTYKNQGHFYSQTFFLKP